NGRKRAGDELARAPKLKLSLKLGALRRHEARAGGSDDEHIDVGAPDTGEAGGAHIDIDAPDAGGAGGAHTPRLKLRLSLKGAAASPAGSVQTACSAAAGSDSEAGGARGTTVSLGSSLQRLITRIRKRDSYGFFLEPVDTEAVADYRSVIAQPMDLGTMQRRVAAGAYRSIGEFRSDVLLVCANARRYNGAASIYARAADRVQEYALVAIARETAKLERVGQAALAHTSSTPP
ncbi:hypothetical protein IWW55_007207, partial [Coemansia sp. RSA 2706]